MQLGFVSLSSSLTASGTLNMMKLGSGIGWTDDGWTTDVVRMDKRECQNSYVDLKFVLLRLLIHHKLSQTVMKRVILLHKEGLVDFQMNTNVLQQRDTP